MTQDAFAAEVGPIIGDVNHAHPFRDGNGRTQLQFLRQLTQKAGHEIDLGKLKPEAWIEASRQANRAEHGLMTKCISEALIDRARGREDGASGDDRLGRLRETLEASKKRQKPRDRDERER